MSILFYNSADYINSKRLLTVVGEEVLKEKVEIVQTLGDLSKSLRKPNRVNDIAVLFVEDMADFYHILAMKKSFNDVRLILILPNRSSEMVSAGHRLHPRFISYIDSDFKDVADVLRRLIKLSEKDPYAAKVTFEVLQ
jgi:hypothetical protein